MANQSPRNIDDKTIALVGLGLLGSSIAEGLKSKQIPTHIIGISSSKTIQTALEDKVIDEGYTYDELDAWISKADLIILCTPIEHIMNYMKMLSDKRDTFKK